MSENQPLLGRVVEGKQQWEWWERPLDAKGRVEHIMLDLDTTASYSAARSSVNAVDVNVAYPKEDNAEIGSLGPIGGHEEKLGQLASTAISGNDITSSVLYVSGIAAASCGIIAPVALLMVAVVLALFRPIYTEVVTALPMNGGAYNALLNTTSKQVASVAAALTILSYTATAVVSAQSAMSYLQQGLWPGLNIVIGTIVVLGIFAALNLFGISESAVVATILFILHCSTLMLLIVVCTIRFFQGDFTILRQNWEYFSPQRISWGQSLFYGYASGMLGITGFETSANFVEQQAAGVFPKTLRNMWIAVAFFNPVIALLSFGIIPPNGLDGWQDMFDNNKTGALLTIMAKKALPDQPWLSILVSVDAVLVLSGAVLTAYVGVTGLTRRLALDRVLFQFLLAENKLRGTNHWIIISFLCIASSLFLIVGNQIDELSAVYTTAFLCVMALFAIGNMLLKYKRSKLARDAYAPWGVVFAAFLAVVAGFIGNVAKNPTVLAYFALYFLSTLAVIVIMFLRIRLLKILLYFVGRSVGERYPSIKTSIERQIQQLNRVKVVFFARSDDIALLNKAVLYVRDNEQTNWLLIVHVYKDSAENIPPKLAEYCRLLDQAYPKFRVDFVAVKGQFGPQLIDELSRRLDVPKNFMFLACPGERFTHKISEMGGVRLVTH